MSDGTAPSGRPDGTAPGDRIQLRGLRVIATHGVLPEEKTTPQPFELDLDLAVDLGPAAASDRLVDTVDYGRVAETAAAVVTDSSPVELLESLAGAVADATLGGDPRIASVTVSLRKLQPPLALDIVTVGVTITRHR